MKLVELQGASAVNKGAHLMSLACVERFKAASPPLECCVYPRSVGRAEDVLPTRLIFPDEISPPSLRKKVTRRIRNELMCRLLSRRDWARYALVRRDEIGALLDISGYAYGDPWASSEVRVRVAEYYKDRGKPVVLMPQMLGPFEKAESKALFRRLMAAADLVCARDALSLERAREVCPRASNLHLVGDLTIGLHRAAKPLAWEERSGVALIPNEKVLQKDAARWGDTYLQRFLAVAQALASREEVSIVVHETGGGDERLARTLAELARPLHTPVIVEHDPLKLKRCLAAKKLVIGSRFHGLVSSFAGGTPGVALGWAHKYETLAADFGVSELQHRPEQEPQELVELAHECLERDRWQALHSTITARGDAAVADLEQLWSRVADLLHVSL